MKRSVLFFLFLLGCSFASFAQLAFKGLPPDLGTSELVIVKYEPEDLIPKDAKSHPRIYGASVNLKARTAAENAALEQAAKAAYPYPFRVISKEELGALPAGTRFYVFEPGQLPHRIGPWNTIPLYLRNTLTNDRYETGSVPRISIYSAEEVMEAFLKPFRKNL